MQEGRRNPEATVEEAPAAPGGLEWLLAIRDGRLPTPPAIAGTGVQLEEAEPGRVVFAWEPREDQYNAIGTVHGGVIGILVDSAIGCAAVSDRPAGVVTPTLELKMNFLRPIRAETGTVRCEGVVLHAGRRTAMAQAELRDADGNLLVHATGTCVVLEGDGGNWR